MKHMCSFNRFLFGKLLSLDFLAVYVILTVAFAAHGLWLINDVMTDEDWIWYVWAKEQRIDFMWVNASHSNSHAGFLPFAMLAFFPDILLGARVTTFLLVWSAAVFTYLIGVRHTSLGRTESLLIALVSLIYPGNMVIHSLGLISYPFYLSVFLLAAFSALEAEELSGKWHWALRISAGCLFLLSFVVGSLLVFYAGFLVIHFCRFKAVHAPSCGTAGPASTATDWIKTTRAYLCLRPDYIIWPVLFWMIKLVLGVFNPLNGYNEPRINSEMFRQFKLFFETIALQLALFGSLAALGIGAVVATICDRMWFHWHKEKPPAGRPLQASMLTMFFGLFLLLCAMFPYAAVGKSPCLQLENTPTRCNLLIGIPMAVLLVSGASLVIGMLGLGQVWKTAFVGALIGAGFWIWTAHGVKCQAYGVRFWSVRNALQECSAAQTVHIWQVEARVPGFDNQLMPDYCAPFFLLDAFGGRLDRYFVSGTRTSTSSANNGCFDEAANLATRLRKDCHSGLHALPRDYCDYCRPPDAAPLGQILVQKGEATGSTFRMVMTYWYYKYFDRRGLPEYLRHVTNVKVNVLPTRFY